MGKTLLITGGCGYIGSHVVRQLSERGYRCIVIDDLSNGRAQALLHNERLVESDYGDQAALEKIFSKEKIDAILHFAASVVVPESVEQPIAYYNNNFVKSITLLGTAHKFGVKDIIFSSTAAIYGSTDSTSCVEDDLPFPASPYGRSKLMVEWLLQDLATAQGLRYGILRYFNVAGADPQGRLGQSSKQASHLIKLACQVAVGKRETLSIYGNDYDTPDGTCIRDYIHVEDLASAHVLALEKLFASQSSAIYNCGYGRGHSVLEVVRAIEAVTGKKLPTEIAPRRAGDVAKLVANSNKLKKELNWKPRHDELKTIVASALEWERKS